MLRRMCDSNFNSRPSQPLFKYIVIIFSLPCHRIFYAAKFPLLSSPLFYSLLFSNSLLIVSFSYYLFLFYSLLVANLLCSSLLCSSRLSFFSSLLFSSVFLLTLTCIDSSSAARARIVSRRFASVSLICLADMPM